MSGWTTDMAAALPDQGGDAQPGGPPTQPVAQPVDNRAKEHGWAPRVHYDYTAYTKSNKELMEDQARFTGNNPDDFGTGGIAPGQWHSNAAVYEWKDEYGDVGPEFPELEKQLFGAENHVRTGNNFEAITELQVIQEGNIRIDPVRKFEDAALHPVMLNNVRLAGYVIPTPIQQYCLPAVAKGHDIVACAQTGSGKTAAFLIPILSKLMGKAKKLAAPRPNPALFQAGISPGVKAEPLVLIVCPSRELATQIFDEARRFCYRTMLRPAVVYGGGPIAEQIASLQKGCDLLIGTPGRLVDFINRPHILTLKRLRFMVIDEADEMLHSDWESELQQIMTGGDQPEGNICYMMFSATFPKICRDLARTHLAHDHVRIRVGRAGSSHANIQQSVLSVEPHAKRTALSDLLLSMPPCRVIIFVNSKRTADELDDYLFNMDFPCTSIHADRTQLEREDAIRAFRSGKQPIMIATGVSARGLDIHNVMHVINFDLPSMAYGGIEEYTHRIGRTGRIGNIGLATSFYTSRDEDLAPALVNTLLENRQIVPDFLEEFIPEGFTADGQTGDINLLKFDADSDNGEDDAAGESANAGGWGGGSTEVASGGWGAPAAADQSTNAGGWGAAPAASQPSQSADAWGAQPAVVHQPTPIHPTTAPVDSWSAPAPVAARQAATESWETPATRGGGGGDGW